MCRIAFTLLLCSSISIAMSQDQKAIDSLEQLLKYDRSRTDLEIFHELSFQFVGKDNALALKYADMAISLSDDLGDSLKIVQTRRLKGQILRRSGRESESFYPFSEALPVAIRNRYQREKGYIYREIGSTLLFLGKFDSALHSYMKALEIWEIEQDQYQFSNDLNNVGLAHYRMGNFEKSLEYSTRALALKRTNNIEHTATTQINIGLAHAALNNYAESLQSINEGLVSCEPNCSDQTKMEAAFGAGYAWLGLQDPVRAKRELLHSYHYAKILADTRFEAECLVWLGNALSSQKNYDSARICLKKAESISKKFGYKQVLMYAYSFLSNLYNEIGNKDATLGYLGQYSRLRDSLFSSEVRSKVLATELEYERQKDLMAIRHQEELLKQKKTEITLVVVLCILLAFLAVSLFILLKNKSKTNIMLDGRVKDRTRELESQKLALEKAVAERGMAVDKAMQSVKSVLATHQGLRKTLETDDSKEYSSLDSITVELNNSVDDLSKIQDSKSQIPR